MVVPVLSRDCTPLDFRSTCWLEHVEYSVVLMDEINEIHVTPTVDDETAEAGTAWPRLPRLPRFPRSDDPSVGVDQRTYDNLVRYTKYASGAYQVLCPRPMGNTLIFQVSTNTVTWRIGSLALPRVEAQCEGGQLN